MDLLCSDLSALPIFFYLSTTSRPGMQPACHTFSFLGFSFFWYLFVWRYRLFSVSLSHIPYDPVRVSPFSAAMALCRTPWLVFHGLTTLLPTVHTYSPASPSGLGMLSFLPFLSCICLGVLPEVEYSLYLFQYNT